ncbi:tetratricopeptide repeat protein [Candidatus Margulisiibacteriota bacterium]
MLKINPKIISLIDPDTRLRELARDECLQALKKDPDKCETWKDLGYALKEGEEVEFNGSSYTEQGCYLKTLEIDPTYFKGWFLLGGTVKEQQTVKVGETNYSRKECYIKVLKINPKYGLAWTMLATLCLEDDTIIIQDKSDTKDECKSYTKDECWKNAQKFAPPQIKHINISGI